MTVRSRNPRRLSLAAGLTVLISSGLVGLTPAGASAAPASGVVVRSGTVLVEDGDPPIVIDPVITDPIVIDPPAAPGGDNGGDNDADPVSPVVDDPVGTLDQAVGGVVGGSGGGHTSPGSTKPTKPTKPTAHGTKKHHASHASTDQRGDSSFPAAVASPYSAVAVDPPILAVVKAPVVRPHAATAEPMATREEPRQYATPQRLSASADFRTVSSDTVGSALSPWVPGGLFVSLAVLVGATLSRRRREGSASLRDL